MALTPLLLDIVIFAFGIIVVTLVMKFFKQPHAVAYILTGIIIGPYALNLVQSKDLIANMGEIGTILLLFFVGLEISIPNIVSNWRVTILGSMVQAFLSIGVVSFLGALLGWNVQMIILIGFVICLSSTAVIFRLLTDRNEIDTKIGQNVIGIAVVQDILFVLFILTINFMSGKALNTGGILLNIIGGIIISAAFIFVMYKKEIRLPLGEKLRDDKDMQIFYAFFLCFGFAVLSSLFHFTPGLGAFLAGFIVASSKHMQWVSETLRPFYLLSMAMFFVYIGIIINIQYLTENLLTVFMLVFLVLGLNTLINMAIFLMIGDKFKESLYAGSILAQIGEFSFILGALGLQNNIVSKSVYDLIVIVIGLTLLLSPFWINFIRKIVNITGSYKFTKIAAICK